MCIENVTEKRWGKKLILPNSLIQCSILYKIPTKLTLELSIYYIKCILLFKKSKIIKPYLGIKCKAS